MENKNKVRVYNELTEILAHIPKDLYDKLPGKVIDYIYQNADPGTENDFVYNVALPIDKQPVLPNTLEAVKILAKTFWRES